MGLSILFCLSCLVLVTFGENVTNITMEHCNQSCQCPEYENTICGTDLVDYFNLCELLCARDNCNSTLDILREGKCPEKVPNPNSEGRDCDPNENCNCNYELIPVCGSDKQTYPNQCVLECGKRCKPDLKKLHFGHCGRPLNRRYPPKKPASPLPIVLYKDDESVTTQ